MTALAWITAYLAASIATTALTAAAIRHGEQQARRERAQLAARRRTTLDCGDPHVVPPRT